MTKPAESAIATEYAEARPLRRRRKADGTLYRREAPVEEQILAILSLSARERRRRLSATAGDWRDAEWLREETLVYFLREMDAQGDDETAGKIAEALIERVSRHVARKIGQWRLPRDAAEDCVADLMTELCRAVYDREEAAEFWEVRFWVCLDRRLLTLVQERQRVADNETLPADAEAAGTSGEDAAGDDFFARQRDTGASPADLAAYREALAQLNENERTALYLVYIEGMPEESDDPARNSVARVLGVTGRSVRNYLRRAKEKLARYRSAGTTEI